ncbi:MAG: sugar phosphate isomerase/epimerase [Archaeoglobaceae archaeon]|nr:sugar phosphate isomerase/epimerase [Archaeoglobaceae archaeon]MCX8152667.1 sugar phosphate isomerase/epimerase [Archaeoglobaceae archaeon]MDW8013668.1 sugar phosphate isomerase/epimerase [Archaeoglobaceae archaeon]
MKIIFSSMFLYEYSTDMISKAAELAELDGVEFWPETPHFWIDRDERKLECLKDLYIALHAPVLDLNPVSVNKKLCNLAIEENLYSISLASKLKAEIVTIHAGKRSARRPPVWADYLSLHRFLRILSKYSRIKNIKLSLENSEPSVNSLCKEPDDVYPFINSYNIFFTFDIKHALLTRKVDRFIEILFDKIVNVHVSYYDERNHHIEPSKSKEVPKILETLSEYDYKGLITLELDDLGIGNLNYSKKIEILKREAKFVSSFFT